MSPTRLTRYSPSSADLSTFAGVTLVGIPAKLGALGLEPLEAAEGSLTRPLEFGAAQGGLSAPEVHLLQTLIREWRLTLELR
jgi:hypothetical protein